MRKLALPEEVLLQIEQPARYIGNEFNSVVKDKEKVALRGAFLFPDVYEIGMSHLGIQILYDMFNKREDMWCERVYSPWPDLDRVMREQSIPLFGLESQEPVKNEDFLFITLQYEMCYTNVLQALDLAGIPLHAVERTDEDPIVIGGGPCTYNPEPIAPFFDLFYIGEGEVVYDKLFDTYLENKKNGGTRQDFLKKACRIPGIYVPQFYEVTYHEDGTIAAFTPSIPEAPEKIKKTARHGYDRGNVSGETGRAVYQGNTGPCRSEIQRGCIRGCRFCQAGMVYRPTRERDVEKLKELATHMLRNTGHDEISLSSLSSSDYSHLPELVNYLIDSCPEKGVNISLPSLRIDAFSLDVMSKVQDIKKSSLTFAPEAGSQRMRNVINKGLTEEVILDGAGKAFEGGWNKVKLYFMLGLPTETEDDIKGIAHLAEKIAERYYEIPKDQRKRKMPDYGKLLVLYPEAVHPVPVGTDEHGEGVSDKAAIVKAEVRAQLNQKSIRYIYHEADISLLEGFLARGDRKCAEVIEKAYRKGAIFDAWSEYFRKDAWEEAFAETGIDVSFYACRERSTDEILPWDFLDIGVTKNS